MGYSLTTQKTWHETQRELQREFELWEIKDWETNYPKGARLDARYQTQEDRTVKLTYTKDHHRVELVMGKQNRAVDNLRVLYLAVEAMRLNEKRGIGEIVAAAYAQLAAPEGATLERDPFEVLGIREDSPIEVAEAVYRMMATKYHPDSKPNGSAERMAELNKAIEKIRMKLKT
jgi:hypothetical protein